MRLSKPNAVHKPDHCTRKATHDRKAKAWRDAAWKKHGFKNSANEECGHCARCQRFIVRGQGGQVDHVKTRSAYPELKYDVMNSRLTCGPCNLYLKTHPLEREL
jgi:5-methylcytosine-specific restriction endonuclease McrA